MLDRQSIDNLVNDQERDDAAFAAICAEVFGDGKPEWADWPDTLGSNEESVGRSERAAGSERAQSGPVPPEPYNMGGTNRNSDAIRGENEKAEGLGNLESGGIDWLGITYEGGWKDRCYEEFEAIVEPARRAGEHAATKPLQTVRIGERLIHVEPHGSGKGFSYCRYTFRSEGVIFSVQVPREKNTFHLRPGVVRAEIKGEACLMVGAWYAVERVEELLRSIGFIWHRACPSRVDLCADLADVDPRELIAAIEEGRVIMRAKRENVHRIGIDCRSLRLGSPHGHQLRIYEKVSECMRKKPPEYFAAMVKYRWGFLPDIATRVEVQIMRDPLRDRHGIDTIDDLKAKLADTIRWCVEEWFRITARLPNRRNTEDEECSPLWCEVQEAFAAWAGKILKHRAQRAPMEPDPKRQKSHLKGALSSFIAIFDGVPCTWGEVLDTAVRKFTQPDRQDVLRQIAVKRKKLEALRSRVG